MGAGAAAAPALELLSRQARGFSLERALHLDPNVFGLELERILAAGLVVRCPFRRAGPAR